MALEQEICSHRTSKHLRLRSGPASLERKKERTKTTRLGRPSTWGTRRLERVDLTVVARPVPSRASAQPFTAATVERRQPRRDTRRHGTGELGGGEKKAFFSRHVSHKTSGPAKKKKKKKEKEKKHERHSVMHVSHSFGLRKISAPERARFSQFWT